MEPLPADLGSQNAASSPMATLTPIDLVSRLFGALGLTGAPPVSDTPAMPVPAGSVLLAALDSVRREMEQSNSNDAHVAAAPQITEANSLNATQAGAAGSVTLTDPPGLADLDSPRFPGGELVRIITFAVTELVRISTFAATELTRIATLATTELTRIPTFGMAELFRIPGRVLGEIGRIATFEGTELIGIARFEGTELARVLADPSTVIWGGGGASDTGMYGDPAKNAQYWEAQSHGNNCVLMSTAMVIGQLTGKMPSEKDIIAEATNTDSVVNEGKKMYMGTTSPDGVDIKDAVALLDNHGITATTTEFQKTEGDKALKALVSALSQQKAAMVGVHGATIWNAVENEPPTEGTLQADHQVVVLGVDLTNRVVYLNDSGFAEQGKNMKVPLDAFMRAWQADNFEMTAAALKADEKSTPAPQSPAA